MPLWIFFRMNLSGALSDGAWKVLAHLAKLKYPTPPTQDNPVGTRSYLGCTSMVGKLADAYYSANHVQRCGDTCGIGNRNMLG